MWVHHAKIYACFSTFEESGVDVHFSQYIQILFLAGAMKNADT